MSVRRTAVVPVAVLAILAFGGCTRSYARKDPPHPTAPRPELPLGRDPVTPVSTPLPPKPPADTVAPPRSDLLARDLPPMPDGPTPPDAPITSASATGDLAAAEAEDGERKRLRDRLRERREERKEKKENPPALDPTPPPQSAADPAPRPAAGGDAAKLLDAAVKRYAEVPDFEARLVKQEVVNGKQLPKDEIVYRFRQKPLSVYMQVLSESGQGREVLYVQGKFGDRMHLVTGKGDNRLVGVGFKTDLDPNDRQATAKSRYRIYEAGFGRTLSGLQKQLAAGAVKSLGKVTRPEYPYPLEGLEVTLKTGDDPQLPRGGKREVYFDPKPESPSYLLPVLVRTTDADGREVEYYCFDRIKVPSGWTDADWNPDRLGKK